MGFMNLRTTSAAITTTKQTTIEMVFWIFEVFTDDPGIPEPENESGKEDGCEELSEGLSPKVRNARRDSPCSCDEKPVS